MADPFHRPDNDPFQLPELNQELPMVPTLGDPSIGLPYAPLDSSPTHRDRNGLVVGLIIGLTLVAIAAVGVAGYFVVKGVESSGESWDSFFVGDDPSWDWDSGFDDDWINTSFGYPEEITDLDALTALPGETFIGDYDALVAGKDISPGIYVAADAAQKSSADSAYCHWSVFDNGADYYSSFMATGSANGGTAILLAPHGYTVNASYACGTWEAVDPATVFAAPTGTVMGEELLVVGYDIKPGMYLSAGPVGSDTGCLVQVRPNFGFEGSRAGGAFFAGEGGTVRLELEDGDFVDAEGCPPFELADPATAYSADAGATTIDIGAWIVGIDVQPGTYRGAPDPESEYGYCLAQVWDGNIDWGSSLPSVEVEYFPDEEPVSFAARLGQTVYVDDCGPFGLVEP